MDFIVYLFIFILVIIGARYATKWISLKSAGLFKGKYISILERVAVDKDKSFIVLKKGDKVYLVGVAGQNMTLIDNFSSDELQQTATSPSEEKAEDKKAAVVPQVNMGPMGDILKKFTDAAGRNIAGLIKKSAGYARQKNFRLPGAKFLNNSAAETLPDDTELNSMLDRINNRRQYLEIRRGGANEK